MTNGDPMKCDCLSWGRQFEPGDLSEDGQEVLTHHPNCSGSRQALERERDELREQVARLEDERDEAHVLLRGCHHAILAACYSEDGCDQSEGEPLLQKLWALFPDLWEAVERDYQP